MLSLTRSAIMLLACVAGANQAPPDKPDEKPHVKVEFRLAEAAPAEGLTEAKEAGTDRKVYLYKTADLTNADIDRAGPGMNQDGKPVVELVFTKNGGEKLAKMTNDHIGKLLAVLVDGKVILAPRINARISQRAVIDGRFTEEQRDKLVKSINGK